MSYKDNYEWVTVWIRRDYSKNARIPSLVWSAEDCKDGDVGIGVMYLSQGGWVEIQAHHKFKTQNIY